MYSVSNYISRGMRFLNNQWFPRRKKLSTLMIYGTDLCDSACKHCLIWTKRPVNYLPFEKIKEIMKNKCITKKTTIGLEGGEFLLHPDAMNILAWFCKNHPNFDLLSNALNPEKLIEAAKKFPPKRLFISVDGDKETYSYMRGKDGYDGIIKVLETLKGSIPISLMFTLTPYNDFSDLEHVAKVAQKYNTDLRIGVYNDISFFDTIDNAHNIDFGTLKNVGTKSIKELQTLLEKKKKTDDLTNRESSNTISSLSHIKSQIPDIVKKFPENYDFLVLYDEWRRRNLKLNCYSILDSLVVLPNGDVPICQNLDKMMGNVFNNSLDQIFNGSASIKLQKQYSKNCNGCWINFHRKYDIILYRNFERFFGRYATTKLLGQYWWEAEKKKSYRQILRDE